MLRYLFFSEAQKEVDREATGTAVACSYFSLCPCCWPGKFCDSRCDGAANHRNMVPFRLPWHGGGTLLRTERANRRMDTCYCAESGYRCYRSRHTTICRAVVSSRNTRDTDRFLPSGYDYANRPGENPLEAIQNKN